MSRSRRQGFTLIELLIVVVIIGILSAIAIPKMANTKDKAKIASMKTDLHNFVTAQEGHYSDYNQYATAAAASGAANATTIVFAPSPNNALGAPTPTLTGFHVTMTNTTLSVAKTCGVFVGNTPPPAMPAGTREGSVACW
jgi:prepilin-type N-terminal cleavage/methylation domain-containing protein